jgi:hypothetical protein
MFYAKVKELFVLLANKKRFILIGFVAIVCLICAFVFLCSLPPRYKICIGSGGGFEFEVGDRTRFGVDVGNIDKKFKNVSWTAADNRNTNLTFKSCDSIQITTHYELYVKRIGYDALLFSSSNSTTLTKEQISPKIYENRTIFIDAGRKKSVIVKLFYVGFNGADVVSYMENAGMPLAVHSYLTSKSTTVSIYSRVRMTMSGSATIKQNDIHNTISSQPVFLHESRSPIFKLKVVK